MGQGVIVTLLIVVLVLVVVVIEYSLSIVISYGLFDTLFLTVSIGLVVHGILEYVRNS